MRVTIPKHVYHPHNLANHKQSQSDEHWTKVVNYAHQHNIIQAANQYKHCKHWLSQGKPDLYHVADQRHNQSSRLGGYR